MYTIARTLLLTLITAHVAVAQSDEDLLAAADAQRQAAPASAQAADDAPDAELDVELRAARLELRLAEAKVKLVQARKHLSEKRYEPAALLAQQVLGVLKPIAAQRDVTVFELQAEGIIARAAKHGVKLPAARVAAEVADRETGAVDAAQVVGQRYSGPPRDVVRNDVSTERLRRLAEGGVRGDEGELRPGAALIDRQRVLERDEQRLLYSGALHELIKADEARLLTAADEARIVPDGDLSYPADWLEKVERRKRFEGGLIARSDSWKDEAGREWYVGIYDIADLTLVPPNFQPAASIDLVENLRNMRDREALRLRSGIFNSYNPVDIAYGIQLLRYFGGLDDPFGPRHSLERQQQIVEMLRAINVEESDAKIIALPPIEAE